MPLKKKKKKTIKRKAAPRRKAAVRKEAVKRKVVKRKVVKKENIIGVVTHYFSHIRAAVIKLKAPLAVGDTVKIKGHTTDFTQAISSMQINHVPVNSAKKGQEIGVLVDSRVREHDVVTKA